MRSTSTMLLILLSLIPNFCYASEPNNGMEALESASRNNQYTFLFFYKERNPRTEKAQQILYQALPSLNTPAKAYHVNLTDPKEQAIVTKFDVKRAPMPLVLVIAPNGAITGGFPSQITPDQLESAIVSNGMASVLKGMQDRKLVFLSFQNKQTRNNTNALHGIENLNNDSRFKNAVVLVLVDPQDKNEMKLLNQFEVDTNIAQATTIFLAPPGDKIGKYVGATSKEQFVSDLQKAVSCCCPGGCCPGGCCPGGCCGK